MMGEDEWRSELQAESGILQTLYSIMDMDTEYVSDAVGTNSAAEGKVSDVCPMEAR